MMLPLILHSLRESEDDEQISFHRICSIVSKIPPNAKCLFLLQNHCCGAQGPDDWDFNIYFNCSSESKSREKCGVPFSCCIPDPAVSCFLALYCSDVIEEL